MLRLARPREEMESVNDGHRKTGTADAQKELSWNGAQGDSERTPDGPSYRDFPSA